MKKAFILGGITLGLPLLAADISYEESFDALGLGVDLKLMIFILLAFLAIILMLNILLLRSVSSFAKSMKLENKEKETSGVWIWTQLIPIWTYIAALVTLIKLNKQYKAYVLENSSLQLRPYNSIWGWIWYISSLLLIVFSIFPLAPEALYLNSILIMVIEFSYFLGFVGFWVHISEVRKSIEANVKI